jgi:hypothetical protein
MELDKIIVFLQKLFLHIYFFILARSSTYYAIKKIASLNFAS